MALTSEWRTKGDLVDAVLIVDDTGSVREALPASQDLLYRYLAQHVDDLEKWRGEQPVEGDNIHPEAWGQLVISRADGGEIIEVEPELFWKGIYVWFRSKGVDYNSPGLHGDWSTRD